MTKQHTILRKNVTLVLVTITGIVSVVFVSSDRYWRFFTLASKANTSPSVQPTINSLPFGTIAIP